MLEAYLKRIGKSELFNQRDKVVFYYQGEKINFDNNNNKIKDLFYFNDFNNILVSFLNK